MTGPTEDRTRQRAVKNGLHEVSPSKRRYSDKWEVRNEVRTEERLSKRMLPLHGKHAMPLALQDVKEHCYVLLERLPKSLIQRTAASSKIEPTDKSSSMNTKRSLGEPPQHSTGRTTENEASIPQYNVNANSKNMALPTNMAEKKLSAAVKTPYIITKSSVRSNGKSIRRGRRGTKQPPSGEGRRTSLEGQNSRYLSPSSSKTTGSSMISRQQDGPYFTSALSGSLATSCFTPRMLGPMRTRRSNVPDRPQLHWHYLPRHFYSLKGIDVNRILQREGRSTFKLKPALTDRNYVIFRTKNVADASACPKRLSSEV
jgi:hypothetical protein